MAKGGFCWEEENLTAAENRQRFWCRKNRNIFRELFRMSEEEFGLPRNGPITLPCDAAFMEYVVSLVQGHASKDLEKALLISMDAGRFSAFSSHPLGQTYQQQLRCF
uniref:Uncharacterized protein n=1 Tax=Nelumbo nucifera TaxID=4432 RepID=A0A822ZA55_NELNU|nr:TPA_asm: hypothetical protein HUJ06_016090 [Nelumbo nucifera]